MARSVNVLALVKDNQRYVFLFDDESHDELLCRLGESASDEELNFTWYDAAVLSQRVRQMRDENPNAPASDIELNLDDLTSLEELDLSNVELDFDEPNRLQGLNR